MPSVPSIVRGVLAHHVRRDASSIHPWQDLDRDLDVSPLELVLIALELEEIEDVPIPVEGLEHARTVGEICTFFARAVALGRRRRVLGHVA